MSRIDWQAYEDGSLSPEEMVKAEALLIESEAARSELAGLRQFRATLQETGLQELVPTERLENALRRARARPNLRVVFGAASLAVAAVLIWAFVTFDLMRLFDPLRLDHSPTIAKIETQDPREAARWAMIQTGYSLPVLDLGVEKPIGMVRHGTGWVCYDYTVGGERYFLYICPDGEHYDGKLKTELTDGISVVEGRGVGFEHQNVCYYVRGPNREVMREIAKEVYQKLETGTEVLRPVSIAPQRDST